MARGDWRERILESTRGRVVALLRRSEQTVGDLSRELGLTDNAVRLHLSALERDGLVEQHGRRREWTGKPAFVYRTTAEAEELFPKPYDLVLSELLGVLEERHERAYVEQLLRAVGARLGASAAEATPDLRERVKHAATVLTGLGGLAEVQEDEEGFLLQGYSCPLAELTAGYPETCLLAESLVSELVGAPAAECCERGERPRCAFRIAAA
jgi:predicted ArsR family transcriptional regulator